MITLKKNHDRRIRRGHLWVFSNEIGDPSVSSLEPGSIHEMRDSSGEFLGMVYVNPGSLIAARILSRRRTAIDEDFFKERILSALDLRKRLYPFRQSYRLIFSESDFLPGLIVDRYGSVLVLQSLTAGMDALLEQVVGVLVELLSPDAIYLRNDSPVRLLEGLQQEKRPAYRTLPEQVTLVSGGLRLLVDVVEGQKTGFFLDQESNRLLMDTFTFLGARVLDLFCYTGAWGLHAATAGADEVTAVDTSERALGLAQANAEMNGLATRFKTVKEPVIDFLKKTRETWDLIVLDPPAFVKGKAHLKEGTKGYIDANRRALTKLKPGGILVTCSCSHHLDIESFEQAILAAARQSGRDLRILATRGQGPDHPVLLSMPETRYLKLIAAQAV